ncbi:MAG: bifunctional glutamate N-acetyltransferase/amino-acid acetyltransferase ArgJ [Clostridiales Family XIII bacterium]|jgi:glutamate N-acetyltransferase/amino-acid N-acetyltransferase|nr:bifunctional glutamate N-acetyltransferase/amino-acid acetyltransferase ArgJ [Clostridiales Family XIII bacterium]
MSEIKIIDGGICAPQGFYASGIHAGFKKSKNDLAVIYSEALCDAAAVYTTNKVYGAPITVTKKHLRNGKAQAVLVNSGNANTCAAGGVELAEQSCALLARELGINAGDVISASTGVIGVKLDLAPFEKGLPKSAKFIKAQMLHDKEEHDLSDMAAKHTGSLAAASAIMTTDTFAKDCAVRFHIGDQVCRIGGIAKGSGMINPKMATMLSFITTDVNIDSKILKESLKEDVDKSFNQISVDGDTSTNDTLAILANGLAGNERITSKDSEAYQIWKEALHVVTTYLSKAMAKDGEGATKLIECSVIGAKSDAVAKLVSKSVISSDLVKTAVFGCDANWGRILCAIGYTDASFDASNVDVDIESKFGKVSVCKGSFGVDFDDDYATKILGDDEIIIHVNLNEGDYEAKAYGCDLTYQYVKINGAYRT